MNLKYCWTDTIVIVYLIMYNIYITIVMYFPWMYRHKPLSLYLQLQQLQLQSQILAHGYIRIRPTLCSRASRKHKVMQLMMP